MAHSPKSARKSPGRPFTGADDPRRGRGPAKGAPNAGRPPDEYKARLRELVGKIEVEQRLEDMLEAKDDRAFLEAYKYCSDKAYGRAPTVIEGGDERKPLTIRLVREVKE